jgi:lipoprotein-anchoring transpeptidase ErfK/SrfK
MMQRFGRLVVSLIAAMAMGLGMASPALAGPVGGGASYTFERGDSLKEIAAEHGVTVKQIIRANGLPGNGRVIPGTVLTIPTADNPEAVSPAIIRQINPQAGDGKVIYVSLSKQQMWAYDGDQLAFDFLVSTGLPTEENPNHETRAGVYRIKTKMPEAFARTWGLLMPYWMGIYDAGALENGFHAMPYRTNGRLVNWRVGTRGSFGCVVLKGDQMKQLYNWADLGTLVVIRN